MQQEAVFYRRHDNGGGLGDEAEQLLSSGRVGDRDGSVVCGQSDNLTVDLDRRAEWGEINLNSLTGQHYGKDLK